MRFSLRDSRRIARRIFDLFEDLRARLLHFFAAFTIPCNRSHNTSTRASAIFPPVDQRSFVERPRSDSRISPSSSKRDPAGISSRIAS